MRGEHKIASLYGANKSVGTFRCMRLCRKSRVVDFALPLLVAGGSGIRWVIDVGQREMERERERWSYFDTCRTVRGAQNPAKVRFLFSNYFGPRLAVFACAYLVDVSYWRQNGEGNNFTLVPPCPIQHLMTKNSIYFLYSYRWRHGETLAHSGGHS